MCSEDERVAQNLLKIIFFLKLCLWFYNITHYVN